MSDGKERCPTCGGLGAVVERYLVKDDDGYEYEAWRDKTCDTCGGVEGYEPGGSLLGLPWRRLGVDHRHARGRHDHHGAGAVHRARGERATMMHPCEWHGHSRYCEHQDEESEARVDFVTKDSGARAEFPSGMVRDTDAGKARFELLLPLGVPYSEQFLTRVAELMARGAEKYDSRNWEKADSEEEMERQKSSALRHLMQWAAGDTDEDHAAAVVFNLLAYETTKWRGRE